MWAKTDIDFLVEILEETCCIALKWIRAAITGYVPLPSFAGVISSQTTALPSVLPVMAWWVAGMKEVWVSTPRGLLKSLSDTAGEWTSILEPFYRERERGTQDTKLDMSSDWMIVAPPTQW